MKRILAAALLLAPLGASRFAAVRGAHALRIGIGSLFLGAIAGAAFVRGLVRIGASRAAVLTFAEPVVAVAVGWLAWGESLGPIALAGAAMIVAAGVGVSRARGAARPAM